MCLWASPSLLFFPIYLWVDHHEKLWLENFQDSEILFYRRYVDDIFCLFHSENQALLFFSHINSRHPNIRFTMEKEMFSSTIDTHFPDTSVYRKKTVTGLLTNYLSFTSLSYKLGLIRTLVDRTYKINNTWLGFHEDITKLTKILQKNLFPVHLVENIINRYLTFTRYDCNPPASVSDTTRTFYFKLPYIGPFSIITQKKIRHFAKRYCNNIDIKLVFSSFKIGSMFSVKDPVPRGLRAGVVYEFLCAGCSACYVGETTRHFSTRVREHIYSDRTSHIFKHLQNSEHCRTLCSNNCFSILDHASTTFQLKIKEAIHIQWEKPTLNHRLCHVNLI